MVSQLPEYCPDGNAASRPLVLIRISDKTSVDSIMRAALERRFSFQHRLLEQAEGDCLAIIGPVGCDTDQFLRSLCYALQQAAGVGGDLPEILENRLVNESFTLFRQEERTDNGASLPETVVHRFGLIMSGSASFGSGLHPSTRLAVQNLEFLHRREAGFPASALDIGCGSGILALVCARLGARQVLAVDRDRQALVAANRNVNANGLQDIVRVESTPVGSIASAWQLVVANLAVSVLHVLLDDLVRLVASRGYMVLAGFQKGQAKKILDLAEQKGVTLLEERELRGWRSFLLRKG